MRRLVRYGIPILVVILFVIGLTSIHGEKAAKPTGLTLAQEQAQLKGSPPQLAALHSSGSQLFSASKSDFRDRIAGFKGTPVVVNKWASWCAPCVGEFPALQIAATRLGKRVAFLGIDTVDVNSDARHFLRRFPVPYPSVIDGNGHIGFAMDFPNGQPMTAFYNAQGKRTYLHQGPYRSGAQLVADVRRYALQQ